MTHFIPVSSTKRDRAVRFGRAMDRAMKARDVGTRPLAEALGASRTTIMYWRTGRILPRLDTAQAIAAALDDQRLVALCVELRTKRCQVDEVPFVDDTGSDNRAYCSTSCQRVGRKRLAGRDTRASAIRAERALARHRTAVEAFCRACEPAGWCQAPDCELRSISPLPLVSERVDITPVATSKRNGWTGPDRAEQARVRQTRIWAAMSPEERAARIDRAADRSRKARGLIPAEATS